VVVGAAIVNGEPVPIAEPVPQPPLYQVKVPPEPPVELSTILPPVLLHIIALSEVTLVGVVGSVFTVTTTLVQAEAVQPAISPLT
jgi:hypothetical protein